MRRMPVARRRSSCPVHRRSRSSTRQRPGLTPASADADVRRRRRHRDVRRRGRHRRGPASAGPRSPNSSRGLRVPGVVERRDLDVVVAAGARRSPRPPRRRGARRGSHGRRRRATRRRRRTAPSPPLGRRRRPRARGESLPELSMSSTRTVTSSPRLRTSSTRSMRLPRPSFEMWSRPSRPGRMLTNAPNLVTFTTLPGVLGAELGGGRVEDQLDPAPRLLDRRAVLRADAHRADDAVVAHRHVGAGLLR